MTRHNTLFFFAFGVLLVASAKKDGGDEIGEKGTSILQVEEQRQHREARAVTTGQLQKMADQVVAQVQGKTDAEITPEVQENIKKMLDLIDIIFHEINLDFEAAELHYANLVNSLNTSTVFARQHFIAANLSDENRFNCLVAERVMLVKWEDCKQLESKLLVAQEIACHLKEFAEWKVAAAHFGEKTCNVKDRDNLSGKNLLKCHDLHLLVQHRGKLQEKLESEKNNYTAHTDTCDQAKNDTNNKKNECENLWTDFQDMWDTCVNQEYNTENLICEFGVSYQEKCDDLKDLESYKEKLVAEVAKHNHSEVDRENEWNAVKKIKCLLMSYTSDVDNTSPFFNQTNNSACLALNTNNYPNKFNYTQTFVESLTTDENFNCSEVGIMFHPSTIHVKVDGDGKWTNKIGDLVDINAKYSTKGNATHPMGDGTDDYTTVSKYKYIVERDMNKAPFEKYCEVNTSTLAGNDERRVH